MAKSNQTRPGRHFLQIPGPSNVPDRVLRAIDQPVIDHRGPEFADFALGLFQRLKTLFGTGGEVVVYPCSGTGAWEAALVNTLSPGDRVLMFETGQFATLWRNVAVNLGLDVIWVEGDWRHGIDAGDVEARLSADKDHAIAAVMAVHNETSTGTVSDIEAVRGAMDAAGHPALLMVDTISSLASMPYSQDGWGVDVTIAASQKGLMLPPGLAFTGIGKKALEAMEAATLAKAYFAWGPMIANNQKGFFPYTPATNLLYGLDEALTMLAEEGLEAVFARHDRLAEATRRAVRGWGLDICCMDEGAFSNTVTAVLTPEGADADGLRRVILENFNMSLGTGLGRMQGRQFRIGHVGDFNDLMLAGTLSGVEMGLGLAGIEHEKGGVSAALEYLAETAG